MQDKLVEIIHNATIGKTAPKGAEDAAQAIIAALPGMVRMQWVDYPEGCYYGFSKSERAFVFGRPRYHVGLNDTCDKNWFCWDIDAEELISEDLGTIEDAKALALKTFMQPILFAFGIEGDG